MYKSNQIKWSLKKMFENPQVFCFWINYQKKNTEKLYTFGKIKNKHENSFFVILKFYIYFCVWHANMAETQML